MIRKLSDDDRRAVDLLLDGSASRAGANPKLTFASSEESGLAAAVRGVERVLSLVALLPVEEPAADLVSRTLARVAKSSGTAMAEHPVMRAIASQQAH